MRKGQNFEPAAVFRMTVVTFKLLQKTLQNIYILGLFRVVISYKHLSNKFWKRYEGRLW